MKQTEALCRSVRLRARTTDLRTWIDTFEAMYHVPPLETPPASVLDLGANIGLTCAHYRALWPEAEIVGYELDGDNAALAMENAPGCRIMQMAVSTYSGIARYDKHVQADSYALGEGETTVQVRSLERAITEAFGPRVDFVKMDIEGEEWRLLEDFQPWAFRVRALLVELHETAEHSELLADGRRLLTLAGFTVTEHLPHRFSLFAVQREGR